MKDNNILVSIKGLSKLYREGEEKRPVLQGLDLDIMRGESVALLGRSGSGKSTLLNLIGGIDLPTGGEVLINGKNLTTLADRSRTLFRRREIGFIYQFFNLIPTLTVEENLLLPLELNKLDHGDSLDSAFDLLKEVGLYDRKGSYPDRLSGGEQQRVAIARALVHDPQLILADEPTGNLDYETGRQVLAILERLVRERGKTLVMVTHSKAVSESADRVLLLAKGKVVETRRLDEVSW